MFLLVTLGGGKWWRFKYRFGGKQKLSRLAYPDVGLREARERREVARTLFASAVDPGEERKAAKATAVAVEQNQRDTLEAVAREWFQKFSPAWDPVMRAS